MKKLFLLLGLLTLPLAPAWAQFYAPETKHHDLAQRGFVVELARVLAWRANDRDAAAAPVARVAYEVSTSDDGATAWRIRCLDAQGSTVREGAVRYAGDALTGGPAWYRDVYRQLACGPTPAAGKLPAAVLAEGFWKGAALAGGESRAKSLEGVFRLDARDDAQASVLAGALTQSALPVLGGNVSLDAVLLARAAAWLCVAEAQLPAGTAPDDALWAPLLLLAGRDNLAGECWKKTPPPADPLAQCWGTMLRQASARETFVCAADPAHRPMAMALMQYGAATSALGMALPDCLVEIFGSKKALATIYDYAPNLTYAGIGGGRLLEGAYPALARGAWLDCLARFRPEAGNFTGYREALDKAVAGRADEPAEDADDSLRGLAAAAPLLNLGFAEGAREELVPTPTVTARDLLNYGWESGCDQLAARWFFVKEKWGVDDLAQAIGEAAVKAIHGSEVFFVSRPFARDARPDFAAVQTVPLPDVARLQFVCGGSNLAAWVLPRLGFDRDPRKRMERCAERLWLRPALVSQQASFLYRDGDRARIAGFLRRAHAEGGPLTDASQLVWMDGYFEAGNVAEVKAWKDELAGALAHRNARAASILREQTLAALPAFERAQATERLFWEMPDSGLFERVFNDYFEAHAYAAAKRFYDQIKDQVDRVTLSNRIGPRRFTLALMEDDRAEMRAALRSSASGSYVDMVTHLVAAARADDLRAMAGIADECIERYSLPPKEEDGKEQMVWKLKAFLPLIPALRDARDPRHGEALDFFAHYSEWPTLQWVLASNARLPADEAVRFLGGPGGDRERRMLVAALLRDKKLFEDTFAAIDREARRPGGKQWANMAWAVTRYLRNDLFEVPVPPDQPDLRPADAQTLAQAVAARLKSGRPGR